MTGDAIESVRSLLEAPSPAVLTTYGKDGSALVSPVWFRWSDGRFEVVIAKGDLKLRHLARDRGAFSSFSKRFDLFVGSRCVA